MAKSSASTCPPRAVRRQCRCSMHSRSTRMPVRDPPLPPPRAVAEGTCRIVKRAAVHMASSSAAVRFAACAATSYAEVVDLIYECIGSGRQFATQMTLVMRILRRQRRAAQKPTGRAETSWRRAGRHRQRGQRTRHAVLETIECRGRRQRRGGFDNIREQICPSFAGLPQGSPAGTRRTGRCWPKRPPYATSSADPGRCALRRTRGIFRACAIARRRRV